MNIFSKTLIYIFLASIAAADVNVSTFNIKWLGYSKVRDNDGIAKLMSNGNRDIIFIQELVSPPMDIEINGTQGWIIKGDKESAAFFEAMTRQGYDYVLSNEDTGTGDNIHNNSSTTEWFVAFYKKDKLTLLDSGYIAEDRSNNDDYERVPYYFTFKNSSGMDFTIISTHLKPGSSKADADRRYHELGSIVSWVFGQAAIGSERDFIILGDMNVYNCATLDERVDKLFSRANRECLNSNLKKTEPFDQVLYIDKYTEIDNYDVIDLYNAFGLPSSTPSKEVISKYSDHHPVFFTIIGDGDDD